MSGFYNVENLPRFNVNNPQINILMSVDDLREFQYHQNGIQNAFPQFNLTELNAENPQSASAPYELTLMEVINGAKNLYYTEDYTGAFAFNGTGDFIPSQVKRFYVNYLPSSLMRNVDTKFPSDYAVAENFGFKINNGYRYYNNELSEGATAENATESHIWGIPENFGIGPPFRVGRGTEILLMWNNPYVNGGLGAPTARFLLRNAYDWLSAGLLKGPASAAYNPSTYFPSDPVPQTTYPNGVPIAGIPTNGVIFCPEPYSLSTQWFY
jgi:hypothetical protein